jgi:hypothetical protein
MLIFDYNKGNGGSDLSGKIIVKSDTMPTPSIDYNGEIYLYSGTTNSSYTHGYIYECLSNSETEYLIFFNPVSGESSKLSFNYNSHSVLELFERIAELSTPTFDAADVASGSFKLDKLNELWYISGKDADGNTLFENFTVSGTGDEYSLDAFGFVYTFPFPDDFENDYEDNFTIQQEESYSYYWERLDVQPSVINEDGIAEVSTPDGSDEKAVVNVQYVTNIVGSIDDSLTEIIEQGSDE